MSNTPLPVHRMSLDSRDEVVLEQIREALRGLRFGSVVITVHDGVVVQIDRTEKRRLSHPSGNGRT